MRWLKFGTLIILLLIGIYALSMHYVGFKLDYYLFDNIKNNNETYCEIVNKSLEGDEKSILFLSKVNVSDGATYQHGAVLLEVINKESEDKYLKVISSLTVEEKKRLYYAILSGFEYTSNPKFENKDFSIIFPKLNKFLDLK